jgi:negative regulator of flagellin synthesis FlgM
MTNRIGPVDHGILGKVGTKVDETTTGTAIRPSSDATDKAPQQTAANSDTVNLTSSAKLLERLDKTLASLPAIDLERVSEIKTAIENGDYEIDTDAIADALIRIDRGLGG